MPDFTLIRSFHMTSPNPALVRDVEARRTFAIISHPDAGKTTLTEKLLLFGGAIQMAGAVKGRKAARHATSDWMEVEKQRGISVTSSVMQFHYRDHVINLLDTPGHEDFSEDTYRVLTAVDAAVMVIDAAKGVEAQTIKLLEVCRMRNTPIITFINKFDREVRDPLDLLSEIEQVLKLQCVPITWPIGMGKTFRGVFSLVKNHLVRFTPGEDRLTSDRELIEGLDNPELDELFPMEMPYVRESIELVQGATDPFDLKRFLAAEQSPVFFGSGVNNFGVEDVLNALVDWAPPPQPRDAGVRMVEPDETPFTGFVFKIQANMDPRHRDRIAFFRVCSGRYQPGMKTYHVREGREMKIPNALTFMAQDRVIMTDAVAGDIIGITTTGSFISAIRSLLVRSCSSRASRTLRRNSSVPLEARTPSKPSSFRRAFRNWAKKAPSRSSPANSATSCSAPSGSCSLKLLPSVSRMNTRSMRSTNRRMFRPRAGSPSRMRRQSATSRRSRLQGSQRM